MTDYIFPSLAGQCPPGSTTPTDFAAVGGLTKRELFAAMAMQGMLASSTQFSPEWVSKHVVDAAIRFADKLIAKLDEKP